MVFGQKNHEEILVPCKPETIFVISEKTGLEDMSRCEPRVIY